MQPTDLDLINSVSQPSIHPDGSRAVFAVTRPDLAADAYVGQLWTIPLGPNAAARRLTRGYRDTAPQYAPNGRLIGFLRADPGKPSQLYVVDAAGGEPVQVTDRDLGVSEFSWSPDSRRIAFVSRDPEQGRYGTVEGLDAGAEPPRKITTYFYIQNGLGYDIDRRSHVYLVDVPDVQAEPVVQPAPDVDGKAEPVPAVPTARRISTVDTDHHGVRFAPDGRALAAVAAIHPGRDTDRRTDVVIFELADDDAEAPEPINATGERGGLAVTALSYAEDGRLFLLASDLGPSGIDFVGRCDALYVIEDSAVRRLTDPTTHDIGDSYTEIIARRDGTVLAIEGDHGSHQVVSVAADGAVSRLTDGPIDVTGIAAGPDPDGPIMISYGRPDSFGDLGLLEPGGVRELTDFSAAIRERGIVRPTELTIAGRDGYPVHGWLAVPDGDGPFPVLLMIHGGPFAAYGPQLFDETQVLTGAGYAVAYCNPRGSRTYGEDHGRAIRQRMGTVDLQDVLDFFDGAIASEPRVDGDRAGILGGSYGGYLTAWTIAHDHRWRGAIIERGFLDPELFFGTSDIGPFFGREYVGDGSDQVAAQSPQAKIAAVSTPSLLMHSELDLRCPLSQAERYYATLKRQGVDTELVIFPGENHELSRSGRPRHRRQRFELILDWWQRRLQGE
ncbi:MAG TPA: S9 family peptidase [Microlunatus sp.]